MSRKYKIVLRYPFRYSWNTFGSVSLIGPGASEALAASLASVRDPDTARAQLQASDGSFAAVLETENVVLAATDRVRSIPLFYNAGADSLILTDDISDCSVDPETDAAAATAFVKEYCCPGNTTLLRDWKQLQAGEFLFFDKRSGSLHTERYHRFDRTGDSGLPDPEQIRDIYLDVFRDIVDAAAGRPLILPLSGGYDSRCIAACLKLLGAGPVLCYTYGRADSPEKPVAQQVAETLGFDWHFVEYDEQRLDVFLTADWYRYADRNHHFTSLPHEQDFFALYDLQRRGLLPPDGIVLPGFLGDYFAGSMFTGDMDTAVAARYQDAYISDRGCKFIVNAVRVYEHFGLEWRLPFASKAILDLWFGVDWRLRSFKNAYNELLCGVFFDPQGIGIRKADHRYESRPIRKLVQFILSDNLLRQVRAIRSYRPAQDPNNTRYLLEKLGQAGGEKLNNLKIPFNEAHARFFLARLPGILRKFE